MGTISKEFLSGSTSGRPILISNISTPGNTIHTTPDSSTIIDEVWLYATNLDSVSRVLTIEYGGTGLSDKIEVTVPSKSGLVVVVPGLIISGAGESGNTIRAFATSNNVINIVGYVNRITPP